MAWPTILTQSEQEHSHTPQREPGRATGGQGLWVSGSPAVKVKQAEQRTTQIRPRRVCSLFYSSSREALLIALRLVIRHVRHWYFSIRLPYLSFQRLVSQHLSFVTREGWNTLTDIRQTQCATLIGATTRDLLLTMDNMSGSWICQPRSCTLAGLLAVAKLFKGRPGKTHTLTPIAWGQFRGFLFRWPSDPPRASLCWHVKLHIASQRPSSAPRPWLGSWGKLNLALNEL